jgi:hypothetical protein
MKRTLLPVLLAISLIGNVVLLWRDNFRINF